jgi:hypothetical protein
MRLAAPCVSDDPAITAFVCATATNTSSVFVFSEISMLDSMVAQASAGAIRALPRGLFASLVSRDMFIRKTAGDGDDTTAYHSSIAALFTDPAIQLPSLPWPSILSNEAHHAAWLLNAAVDAWLSIVPFPYLSQAHDVIAVRSSESFAPNASDAMGYNGRKCTLAALYLDRSQHFMKINDVDQFVAAAWLFVDFSAVCLFSVRSFGLMHPSHARIKANFVDTFWKVIQLDRSPLPDMPGCDEYVRFQCVASISQYNYTRSYIAKDGKRLMDLYGHLPGYWFHPSLIAADFEKNITKWSGAQ